MVFGKNIFKTLTSVISAAVIIASLSLVPSTSVQAVPGINELTCLPTAAPELQRPVAVMITTRSHLPTTDLLKTTSSMKCATQPLITELPGSWLFTRIIPIWSV